MSVFLLGCGGATAIPDDSGTPARDAGRGRDVDPGPEAGRAPDALPPSTDGNPGFGDGRGDGAGPLPGDGSAGGDRATSAGTPGCGKPAVGTSGYERRTVTIRGVEREYFLWVPRTYDPARPYPVVFRWHGSGGNGTSGGLEIEGSAKEDAIIVSPSGAGGHFVLDPAGPDVALFDTLLAQLGGELCLDPGRVFSYGFSNGGYLTNLLGCVRASVLRGVAPVEGGPSGDGCSGRVAAWITHGTPDTAVALARGAAARDRYLAADGCSATALPTAPAPCVLYQGCAAAYPVVWCQTDSPHDPQGRFTAPGAWSFFRSLPPR
jgi:polyhydroxybutyrate depolymerase